MNPEDADETAINPFDLWEGANFRLKIRKVAGYRNYDKSAFDSVGPLLEDDDKLEEIWKQEHSLKEYTDPANYKSYEDLQARLNKVLGVEGKPEKTVPKGGHGDEPAPKKETRKAILDKTPEVEKVDDEDADELAYFRSLANADED